MATSAPCSAKARAMARPIRFAPPVTRAVFPVRGFFMVGLLLRRIRLSGRSRWRCGLGRLWGLLDTDRTAGGFALVVLVGGDLLLRTDHADGDLPCGFGD